MQIGICLLFLLLFILVVMNDPVFKILRNDDLNDDDEWDENE